MSKEVLNIGRSILTRESVAIGRIADTLDGEFEGAVNLILGCKGRVLLLGIGKSGHVARKIAATLASTGQPAFFIHAGEAMHGDSGVMVSGDVCVMVSHSGETPELLDLVAVAQRLLIPIVAITGNSTSSLAKSADIVLKTHVAREACPMNLVPTTSTAVSMALGDALALTLMEIRGFGEKEFAVNHPGGSIGRRLMDITEKVDAVTKIGEDRIKAGGVQPAPKSVKIEITNRCGLRCKFCALRTRKKPGTQDMPLEFFKKITRDMKGAGVEEIGLFYLGESFMAPHLLIEACRWAKKYLQFDWVFLTSNATNADPGYVSALMEAGLDSLKWSVNSSDTEKFRAMTGGTTRQWDAIIRNIRAAYAVRNAKRLPTIISASSIQYDGHQPEDIEVFLKQNVRPYVDKHYWLPMYSMSMYRKRVEKDTGFVPSFGNMGRIDEATGLPNRRPLPCWAAFTEGHVRVDGSLSACCFGADDRFDMGKLDGTNFMDEWNSPAFQALREAQLRTMEDGHKALEDTPCRVCVAWDEKGTKHEAA